MMTPPLIIGAALLVWGLQTGLWPFALPLALILESAHVFKTRWNFSGKDLMRMTDLGTLMVIGFAVFFLASDPVQAIYGLIVWLPVCFFPLAAFQAFHAENTIDIRYLFFVLRKHIGREEHDQPIRVNMSWPYLIACLVAAGSSDGRSGWYYPAVWIICVWALWGLRSRRFSVFVWFAIVLSCGATGFFAQAGLNRLQNIAADWYMRNFYSESDPYKRQTAIGDIGSLKPSDRIVFRIKSRSPAFQPILLREATYDAYLAGSWFAGRHRMEAVKSAPDGTSWTINNASRFDRGLTVAMPLDKGRGVLKLPYGTGRIENLPVGRMEINRLGTVRVEDGPGLLMFQAFFDTSQSGDNPPVESDLNVPPFETQALAAILPVIKPSQATKEEVIRNVGRFFDAGFHYSLNLKRPKNGMTALADFLTNTRAGHCEYFATATVLLLRAAGIPARYATGYAAFEDGRYGKWHIVRERHAHAWAEAYVNGRWIVVDTTPAGWASIEAEKASFLEPLGDLWSHLKFRIAQWRWQERENRWRRYLAWLLIPLTLYMTRGLFRRKRKTDEETLTTNSDTSTVFPGHDSEFYKVEAGLIRRGLDRQPGETYTDWFNRIGHASPIDPSDQDLGRALNLHYRLRFDPRGIEPEERRQLADCVETILVKLVQ